MLLNFYKAPQVQSGDSLTQNKESNLGLFHSPALFIHISYSFSHRPLGVQDTNMNCFLPWEKKKTGENGERRNARQLGRLCVCEVCACVLGVGTGRQRLSPRQSVSCRIKQHFTKSREGGPREAQGKKTAWASLVKWGVSGGWRKTRWHIVGNMVRVRGSSRPMPYRSWVTAQCIRNGLGAWPVWFQRDHCGSRVRKKAEGLPLRQKTSGKRSEKGNKHRALRRERRSLSRSGSKVSVPEMEGRGIPVLSSGLRSHKVVGP